MSTSFPLFTILLTQLIPHFRERMPKYIDNDQITGILNPFFLASIIRKMKKSDN